MKFPEARKHVIEKVKQNIADASAYYGRKFDMPNIKFALTGTTAGTANPSKWELNFHPTFLMENFDHYLESTVPHEVAHLIDYAINPENFQSKGVTYTRRGVRRGKRTLHGPTFKFIMKTVLGAEDNSTCHNYDTSNLKTRKTASFEYRCSCGCNTTVTMGPTRHKKEQANPGHYHLRGHGKARLLWVDKPIEMPLPVAAQNTKKPSQKRPTGNQSTKDLARAIFNTSSDRSTFITRCVNDLGMKKTTASTYHHNFKSGKWV